MYREGSTISVDVIIYDLVGLSIYSTSMRRTYNPGGLEAIAWAKKFDLTDSLSPHAKDFDQFYMTYIRSTSGRKRGISNLAASPLSSDVVSPFFSCPKMPTVWGQCDVGYITPSHCYLLDQLLFLLLNFQNLEIIDEEGLIHM